MEYLKKWKVVFKEALDSLKESEFDNEKSTISKLQYESELRLKRLKKGLKY